jgi:hypothetical protein
VSADTGQPLNWWWKRPHNCLARWTLLDTAEWPVQISVGTLSQGGWYVDHGGFGCRGFPDKAAAWAAIRHLMSLHDGSWEQLPGDSERLSPQEFDGSRTLFSESLDCMQKQWGRLREERWASYVAAINAGTRLEQEEIPGYGRLTLTEYLDPFDRSARFAVDDHGGLIHELTDYQYRKQATRRYSQLVVQASYYASRDLGDRPRHRREGGIVLYDGLTEYERSLRTRRSQELSATSALFANIGPLPIRSSCTKTSGPVRRPRQQAITDHGDCGRNPVLPHQHGMPAVRQQATVEAHGHLPEIQAEPAVAAKRRREAELMCDAVLLPHEREQGPREHGADSHARTGSSLPVLVGEKADGRDATRQNVRSRAPLASMIIDRETYVTADTRAQARPVALAQRQGTADRERRPCRNRLPTPRSWFPPVKHPERPTGPAIPLPLAGWRPGRSCCVSLKW